MFGNEGPLHAMEIVVAVGGAVSVVWYGVRRVYNTARGVEKILEFTIEEKEARGKLAADLVDHIQMEDTRDRIRDKQLIELVANVREISREIRPDGGSSMKDVLNHTAEAVGDIKTRVAVLEEWKRNEEK